MSYSSQAKLAQDPDLLERIAACTATQGIRQPVGWAYDRQWQLSAQPGWSEAYEYALTISVDSPGKQENVISDTMILSAVQAIIADDLSKVSAL